MMKCAAVLAAVLVVACTQPAKAQQQPVKELLNAIDALNHQCRGGSGDDPKTQKACVRRDAKIQEAARRGWCRGPQDAIGADQHWMRCSDDPARQMKTESQAAPEETRTPCQQLYQGWVFNRLLEEACGFDKKVAITVGIVAKGACSSLSEEQRDAWGRDVMTAIHNDIADMGSKKFCRLNKAGYDDLAAEQQRERREALKRGKK